MTPRDRYNVEPVKGCHLWQLYVAPSGYGKVTVRGKRLYAHRLAYERAHGEIPAGLLVCHTCDVRHCVNPAHLFLGSHRDNMQDACKKNRLDRSGRHGEKNGRAKLTGAAVQAIRAELAAGHSQRAVAKAHRVGKSTVALIATKQIWQHV